MFFEGLNYEQVAAQTSQSIKTASQYDLQRHPGIAKNVKVRFCGPRRLIPVSLSRGIHALLALVLHQAGGNLYLTYQVLKNIKNNSKIPGNK